MDDMGAFSVNRNDIKRIVSNLGTNEASTLAVWIALCDIEDQMSCRGLRFTCSVGLIKHTAGISRSCVFRSFQRLEGLKMLVRIKNETTFGGLEENSYMLIKSTTT